MYCKRVSVTEANNKIMEEAETFIKKYNLTQKKPWNTTKSTRIIGILQDAEKYLNDQEIETRKFPPKKSTVEFRTRRMDLKAPRKQATKKKMKKSISRTSKLFLAFS